VEIFAGCRLLKWHPCLRCNQYNFLYQISVLIISRLLFMYSNLRLVRSSHLQWESGFIRGIVSLQVGVGVLLFNATFSYNNISVILWQSVLMMWLVQLSLVDVMRSYHFPLSVAFDIHMFNFPLSRLEIMRS